MSAANVFADVIYPQMLLVKSDRGIKSMFSEPSPELAERLDQNIQSVDMRAAFVPYAGRWIRLVREALGMPLSGVARRMGISHPAVAQLEQREAAGTVSIERMTAVADALGCDFVYGFVPRRTFREMAITRQGHMDEARETKKKIPRA